MANCYIAMGHKVLIVSDRVSFLKYIHENVKGRSALFIGEISLEDRIKIILKKEFNVIENDKVNRIIKIVKEMVGNGN